MEIASDKKVKCVTCGKILQGGDVMYQACLLETLNGGVEELLSPTCSIVCAETARHKCLSRWYRKLSGIENQSFQIMTVNQFYGAI